MTEELKIEIAPMRRKDVPAVLEIQADTGLSFWSEASYRSELQNPDARLYSAKIKDLTVGFLVARLITNENLCEIYNIGVASNYQNMRIGTSLLMQLFSGFGREIERVLLEVREGNEKAKNFYKKHGFVTIAKRANYYQSPLDDALVMEKQMENIVATGNKLG